MPLRERSLPVLLALASAACASAPDRVRPFPDRPVAWSEHDDRHLSAQPRSLGLEDEDYGRLIRNLFTREADRVLSIEPPRPAEDVNALDEVPCSTWFCPRNHLTPLAASALVAGPPGLSPPQLPLTILKGKSHGVAPGFVARDARGKKYLIKFDPIGHLGLASSAEVMGNRLVHAAGYNVPGAFIVEVTRADLRIAHGAYLRLSDVAERPFTPAHLAELLEGAAVTKDGRFRAVASPWIPGKILGGIDFFGRRPDDANDRIRHEDRRSLRATYLLFGWLNVTDPGTRNSIDSYVEEGGRRFVRHYLLDFGTGFGAGTIRTKAVAEGREYPFEVGRMLGAAATLGVYQRDWQRDVDRWRDAGGGSPDVGWFYPVETWRPDAFRPGDKLPAHTHMTERDGYWGAKVVTSFTDGQIHAVVESAGYSAAAAADLEEALRTRRDRIAERYLLAYAAVESPTVSDDGGALCFQDLAMTRGYARPGAIRYRIAVSGADATPQRISESVPEQPTTCVPLAEHAGQPYLVVSVQALLGQPGHTGWRATRPTRFHLRWRDESARFVVVGVERED